MNFLPTILIAIILFQNHDLPLPISDYCDKQDRKTESWRRLLLNTNEAKNKDKEAEKSEVNVKDEPFAVSKSTYVTKNTQKWETEFNATAIFQDTK